MRARRSGGEEGLGRRDRQSRLDRRVVACLIPVLSLLGCGTAQDDAVTALAEKFAVALERDDGAAACALLAPRTKSELEQASGQDCAQGVLEEPVPTPHSMTPSDVEVFGTSGRVRWDGETVFLARFQGGWKVLAAGCRPSTGQTYDCVLKGG